MKHVLFCMAVVCIALSACGSKATPDPAEVARAVAATLTAQAPTATPVPTNTPVPTPTPAVQTYCDDTFGIAVDYPHDWQAVKSEAGAVVDIREATGGEEAAGISMTPSEEEWADAKYSLRTYVDTYLVAAKEARIVEGCGPRTFGSQDGFACVVEFAPVVGGDKTVAILGLVQHPETTIVYFIIAGAPPELWDKAEPDLQAILDSVEFFVPTTPAQAEDIETVEWLDWTWYETSDNYISIDGEIQNVSSRAIRYVKVHVKLLDANGKLLGVDSGYTEPMDIPPGGKALFSIMARNMPGLDEVEMSQVTWD